MGDLSNCREQSAKPARVLGREVQHRAGTVAATGEPRGSLTPRMQPLLGKSQPFGQGGRRKIGGYTLNGDDDKHLPFSTCQTDWCCCARVGLAIDLIDCRLPSKETQDHRLPGQRRLLIGSSEGMGVVQRSEIGPLQAPRRRQRNQMQAISVGQGYRRVRRDRRKELLLVVLELHLSRSLFPLRTTVPRGGESGRGLWGMDLLRTDLLGSQRQQTQSSSSSPPPSSRGRCNGMPHTPAECSVL